MKVMVFRRKAIILHFEIVAKHVAAIKKSSSEYGKVLEWLKRHAWKACNPAKPESGVRIPLFPLLYI